MPTITQTCASLLGSEPFVCQQDGIGTLGKSLSLSFFFFWWFSRAAKEISMCSQHPPEVKSILYYLPHCSSSFSSVTPGFPPSSPRQCIPHVCAAQALCKVSCATCGPGGVGPDNAAAKAEVEEAASVLASNLCNSGSCECSQSTVTCRNQPLDTMDPLPKGTRYASARCSTDLRVRPTSVFYPLILLPYSVCYLLKRDFF